jgi:phosphoribosyl 1,2-cyclic phosphodiesterase
VQGSCPVFPGPAAVEEYKRQVAALTLERVLRDFASCNDGRPIKIEDLIGGPVSADTIQAYQRRLGLPQIPIYGGETTCVEVETADGDVLLFDGGSGIRHFAVHILDRWKHRADRKLHFFGSHEHLDHRSGLPFSRIVFVRDRPFSINVYGAYRFLMALDERFGVFSRRIHETTHLDDPLDFTMMAASFTGIELRNFNDHHAFDPAATPPWQVRDIREPIEIGHTRISAFNVYHGRTRVLAYKIEHGGATFVFSTDHELRHGDPADPREIESRRAEDRLSRECAGVDVAYFDGQYRLAEYLGRKGIGAAPAVPKVDWGHGIIEDVVARAIRCGVKRTYIGHHDPDREWPEQVEIDRELQAVSQANGVHIELAKPMTVIDL